MRLWLPGALALTALLLAVGSALGALLQAAPTLDILSLWQDVYLRHVIWFTCWQALLSTLLSVALAIPVARALARRQRFPGRDGLLKLFGLPLVTPAIVAVFGIVAIYGQAGWLNRLAALLGLPQGQYLYGLPGILIAHVFFNLPLAIRLLLPLWQAVPGETWRLASQFGMRSRDILRLIEWPLLREALPAVAGLIFMLCFTSFAVILTLGGGPAATTIEVAIYQALRFDFEPGRAVLLALLQLGFCALLIGCGQYLAKPLLTSPTPGRIHHRPDLQHWSGRIGDSLSIALAALSVLLPLLAVIYSGLSGPLLQVLGDTALWSATGRSLLIALSAGLLAVICGSALLITSRALRNYQRRSLLAELVELPASLVLVVPPLVLGTGWFMLLMPVADVFSATLALALVILANTLIGLPYVMRILGPPLLRIAGQHGRLCASLNIRGWQRLRLIEWPLLRRPLGLALALCAALATGDLGVIALFGTQDNATLPLLLYQRMASYQMEQAAVTALLLIGLCLILFTVIERGIGGKADA
jgi:thiamine transport system permease protein